MQALFASKAAFLTAAGKRYEAHRAGPDAWEFFYHNAGSSYTPGKQSQIVGTVLGALALARAELLLALALESDAFVQWEEDPDGAEVQQESGEFETLPAVYAMLYVPCADCPDGVNPRKRIARCDRRERCHVRASLCGITESDDWRERNDYRRVVEAELACEAFP